MLSQLAFAEKLNGSACFRPHRQAHHPVINSQCRAKPCQYTLDADHEQLLDDSVVHTAAAYQQGFLSIWLLQPTSVGKLNRPGTVLSAAYSTLQPECKYADYLSTIKCNFKRSLLWLSARLPDCLAVMLRGARIPAERPGGVF